MAPLSGIGQLGGDGDPAAQLDRYMVVGNPIEHSKSPWIHTRFAAQTGQAMTYTRLLVEIGRFAEAIETFQREMGERSRWSTP